jgi:hypothetical protein
MNNGSSRDVGMYSRISPRAIASDVRHDRKHLEVSTRVQRYLLRLAANDTGGTQAICRGDRGTNEGDDELVYINHEIPHKSS